MQPYSEALLLDDDATPGLRELPEARCGLIKGRWPCGTDDKAVPTMLTTVTA